MVYESYANELDTVLLSMDIDKLSGQGLADLVAGMALQLRKGHSRDSVLYTLIYPRLAPRVEVCGGRFRASTP